MISTDILNSVYFIRNGNGSASAFTVEYNHRQYLVTARHFFYSKDDLKENPEVLFNDVPHAEIEILQKDKWKKVKCNIYFHDDIHVDVAVIEFIKFVLPFESLAIDSESSSIGQEVYLMGFPHELRSELLYNTSPYHLPLIKKAIVAGLNYFKFPTILYLDTKINPGFSGGPVIFKNSITGKFHICGILTSSLHFVEEKQDGQKNVVLDHDCGISIATHIGHLEEILRKIITTNARKSAMR